jgi:hypothetical protein
MFLAVAAAEPNRGWGGPLAILAAFALFRVVVMPVGRWVMAKIGNPSPTPALPTAERVKVEATVGFTEPEPVEPESGWWGRIVERGGHRFRQAEQVWRTGDHELPPADDEPDGDPEIDLALDEEEPEERGETAEEYIARARRLGISHGQIVKVLMEYYGINSESTAKRRIREVDEELRREGGR